MIVQHVICRSTSSLFGHLHAPMFKLSLISRGRGCSADAPSNSSRSFLFSRNYGLRPTRHQIKFQCVTKLPGGLEVCFNVTSSTQVNRFPTSTFFLHLRSHPTSHTSQISSAIVHTTIPIAHITTMALTCFIIALFALLVNLALAGTAVFGEPSCPQRAIQANSSCGR